MVSLEGVRQIKVEGFWGWLAALGMLVLAAGIAVIGFTVFLVLLAVGLVAGPFLRKRMQRKMREFQEQQQRGAGAPPGGPVIDVEYEVRDKDSQDQSDPTK